MRQRKSSEKELRTRGREDWWKGEKHRPGPEQCEEG